MFQRGRLDLLPGMLKSVSHHRQLYFICVIFISGSDIRFADCMNAGVARAPAASGKHRRDSDDELAQPQSPFIAGQAHAIMEGNGTYIQYSSLLST